MKNKIFNISDVDRFTNTLIITIDGVDKVLLDANAFKREIVTKYNNWSFVGFDSDTTVTAFNSLWAHFCELYRFNFVMMYNALNTSYAPLDNYDKNSTFVYGEQHTDNVNDERVTTTTHGTINYTSDKNGNTQTITNEETTIDSSSYLPKDKQTILNPQRTNETTQGNDTVKLDGFTDTVINSSYTNTEHTHGNVGTTRTQDMATDEIRLREKALASVIIDLFANKYLFYMNADI